MKPCHSCRQSFESQALPPLLRRLLVRPPSRAPLPATLAGRIRLNRRHVRRHAAIHPDQKMGVGSTHCWAETPLGLPGSWLPGFAKSHTLDPFKQDGPKR